MSSDVVRILHLAKAKLMRLGWSRGEAHDCHYRGCPHRGICLASVIGRASEQLALGEAPGEETYRLMAFVVGDFPNRRGYPPETSLDWVVDWNDTEANSQAEVLLALEVAIDLACHLQI